MPPQFSIVPGPELPPDETLQETIEYLGLTHQVGDIYRLKNGRLLKRTKDRNPGQKETWALVPHETLTEAVTE